MNTQGFDATEFIKGRWLRGQDLPPGHYIELTVATVGVHTFDDGTKRPKVEFLETEQALSLNKTQTATMIQLFGANTAAWVGQRITLTAVPSNYAGKPTIMLSRAAPPQPPTLNGQPAQATPQYPQPPAADTPWSPQPQAGVMFRQP